MSSWVLEFPVPHEPRSVNKLPQSRGAAIGFSKERAKWRDTARAYAEDAIEMGNLPQHLWNTNVCVSIPFSTHRRRDPSNYTGTVVKWVVDGLTAAGVWEDDGPAYVTIIDPELVIGNTVKVTIEEA